MAERGHRLRVVSRGGCVGDDGEKGGATIEWGGGCRAYFCGNGLGPNAAEYGPMPEVAVTAPRALTSEGIAPLLELSPSELQSYGVDVAAAVALVRKCTDR